MAETRHL